VPVRGTDEDLPRKENNVHEYNKSNTKRERDYDKKEGGMYINYTCIPKEPKWGVNPRLKRTWQGRGNTDSLAVYMDLCVRYGRGQRQERDVG
jgi:hypothetical protein